VSSYLLLAFAIFLIAFDFQNLLSWWGGRTIKPGRARSEDFTIVVPVFGHPRYWHSEQLLRHRRNVLVAMETSPPLMAELADQLEADGWNVERLTVEDPDPSRLVAAALPAVTTKYVFRLDSDTTLGDDAAEAVAAADSVGADLCSIKCAVANRTNVVTRLQALEYRMAMLCLHFRPWLTSGACYLARTEALRHIMEQHSKWTPGEDIETGRTALALRMRIRHLDIVVHTDAPDSWRALVRQRRLWWAGAFRHWWINVDRNVIQLPVLTSYYVIAIWVSWYLKWWTMLSPATVISTLPRVYVAYLFVTVVSNLRVLSPWMILFPFYSLAQVIVMPPLGVLKYFQVAKRRRRLGRYRFGYRRREVLRVIRRVATYPNGRP
jgi:cellulose synthase/poly-beta-1,6-N-acetylglucosamine synthase-like glycosyltransferase